MRRHPKSPSDTGPGAAARQQLHSFGLLRGAFRPADGVCALHSYARQRTTLLRTLSRTLSRSVQHMQEALVHMNIHLANTIADVAKNARILRAALAKGRRFDADHVPVKPEGREIVAMPA